MVRRRQPSAPTRPPLPDEGWSRESWVSPDGQWVAAHGGQPTGGTLLYRLAVPGWLGPLLDRPLAAMRPADLPMVVTGEPATAGTPAAPAAAGVRACLQYRFGAEITLSPPRTMSTQDIDIALSPRNRTGPT